MIIKLYPNPESGEWQWRCFHYAKCTEKTSPRLDKCIEAIEHHIQTVHSDVCREQALKYFN